MKLILSFILIVMQTNFLFGMCASSGFSVWPYTKEITRNPILIVEGYGQSQEVILNLNKKYKIYLKSGETKIPLKVIKINESQESLTQAVLKPIVQLIMNKKYTIHIIDENGLEQKDWRFEDFTWTVKNDFDHVNPIWRNEPKYIGEEIIHYGCGPSVYALFCGCYQDKSPVIIRTRVRDIEMDKTFEYYVLSDSSLLKLGHGMCSGEFRFRKNSDYEASFSLMDASGNSDSLFTKTIKFIGPSRDDPDTEIEKIRCECLDELENENNFVWYIGLMILSVSVLGLFYFVSRRIFKIRSTK